MRQERCNGRTDANAHPAQERAYELERAAQIKYETLPNLEEQLIEAEAALKSQVRGVANLLNRPCSRHN